jgi:hypothetical protein
MDELVFITTGSELHKKCKTARVVDDKITSTRNDDGDDDDYQRDETVVESG